MSSARKIVGEWLRNHYHGGGNDRTAEAGAIIAELRKHGFRVLAPDELDPATVERCARTDATPWPVGPFKRGDLVTKTKGSSWTGHVCGGTRHDSRL